jgi:hypothetical protein
MGEGSVFWWGNLKERDHLEGVGIDGSVILISHKMREIS